MALIKFIGLLVAVGLMSLLTGCDIFYKSGLPERHNSIMEGVFHGERAEEPFENGDDGCASTDCHQPDLRGGVAKVDGKKVIAPSCFQCHGRVWEGEGRRGRE